MESTLPNPDPHREMRRQFARLWNAAEKSVQAYVFSMVPSIHDAEDLIQQLAEEVAVHFDEYDPTRSFEAWVIWRAKRRVIDHFRKVDRDRHVFDQELIDTVTEAHLRHAGVTDQQGEALEQCLNELPDRSRMLLDLRYTTDMKPTQIAKEIASTPGSVRVTLLRIRDALADCISRRLGMETGK